MSVTAKRVQELMEDHSSQYPSPTDPYVWITKYDYQAIADELNAATVGRDERESYDAGFASGVKATLQQLYGLLYEYPTLDEIEAWADSQWEVDE